MGRKPGLTDEEKEKVKEFWKEKYSIRKIATKLGRSRGAIKQFLDDPDRYGKKYAGGRPKKLSEQIQKSLRKEASKGKYSCNQLKEKFKLEVHVRTVLNYVNSFKCKNQKHSTIGRTQNRQIYRENSDKNEKTGRRSSNLKDKKPEGKEKRRLNDVRTRSRDREGSSKRPSREKRHKSAKSTK